MPKCPKCKEGELKMIKHQPLGSAFRTVHPRRKERAVMVCDECEHKEVFN